MRRNHVSSAAGLFFVAVLLLCAPESLPAQGQAGVRAPAEERSSLELGIGWGRFHLGGVRSSDAGSLVLDFTVARWLSDHIAVGARLGGWTLEGFNISDPREGESLSEAFALLRVRPLARRPLVITLAGGWASYTANDPAAIGLDGDGTGLRAELTWDFWRSGPWSVGTGVAASWGHIDPDLHASPAFSYGAGALLGRVRWSW